MFWHALIIACTGFCTPSVSTPAAVPAHIALAQEAGRIAYLARLNLLQHSTNLAPPKTFWPPTSPVIPAMYSQTAAPDASVTRTPLLKMPRTAKIDAKRAGRLAPRALESQQENWQFSRNFVANLTWYVSQQARQKSMSRAPPQFLAVALQTALKMRPSQECLHVSLRPSTDARCDAISYMQKNSSSPTIAQSMQPLPYALYHNGNSSTYANTATQHWACAHHRRAYHPMPALSAGKNTPERHTGRARGLTKQSRMLRAAQTMRQKTIAAKIVVARPPYATATAALFMDKSGIAFC